MAINRRFGPGKNKKISPYIILLLVAVIVVAVYLIRARLGGSGTSQVTDNIPAAQSGQDTAGQATELKPEPAVVPPVVSEPAKQPEPTVSSEPQNPDGSSEEAKSLITEALADAAANKIIASRDKLNQALGMPLSPELKETVKAQMARLSEMWLFGRSRYPEDTLTELYNVQPNDNLTAIGARYKVPPEALQQINRISRPEALPLGQNIKAANGPFHAIIYSSTYTMDLYLQNTYVKTYRVGLGREGRDTPTGKWRVKEGGKLVKPKWTDPDTGRVYHAEDPDYPLGSRWIALDGIDGKAKDRTGFAIHGTKDPETIGTRSSRGCIRLFNGDAIEVYNLMVPLDSQVQVLD